MDIVITFPGGKRVDAAFDGVTVRTDQPVESGGDGTAAAPFDLFLASLGTCAGYYVLAFCQARGLATEGLAVTERVTKDEATKLPARIELEVKLPAGFPEKYRTAVQRAAEQCKVKKVLASPPDVVVTLAADDAAAARTAA